MMEDVSRKAQYLPKASIASPHADEDEDQGEWEYEYHPTETETYYVTLDLTEQPDMLPNPSRSTKMGRSRSKLWTNPAFVHYVDPTTGKVVKREDTNERIPTNGTEHPLVAAHSPPPAEGEFPDLEEDESNDDNEGEFFDHTKNVSKEFVNSLNEDIAAARKKTREIPKAVQVMGLHTSKPFVSYGGKLYVCNWTSNIGTELLFTRRDEENPLPAVKSLPGGIDLLAASSIRLKTNVVQAETKQSEDRGQQAEISAAALTQVNSTPEEREKEQISFLKSFRMMKQKKKEEDKITMILKTVNNGKFGDKMRRERREDVARLRYVAEHDEDPVKREAARTMLLEQEEMDEGERVLELLKPNLSIGQKRGPKPRASVKRKRSPGGAWHNVRLGRPRTVDSKTNSATGPGAAARAALAAAKAAENNGVALPIPRSYAEFFGREGDAAPSPSGDGESGGDPNTPRTGDDNYSESESDEGMYESSEAGDEVPRGRPTGNGAEDEDDENVDEEE